MDFRVFNAEELSSRLGSMTTKESMASLLKEELECAELTAQLHDLPSSTMLGEGIVPYHEELRLEETLGHIIERESQKIKSDSVPKVLVPLDKPKIQEPKLKGMALRNAEMTGR